MEAAEEDGERDKRILELCLQCLTQDKISEGLNTAKGTVNAVIEKVKNGTDAKNDFDPNLYDVWNYVTNDEIRKERRRSPLW